VVKDNRYCKKSKIYLRLFFKNLNIVAPRVAMTRFPPCTTQGPHSTPSIFLKIMSWLYNIATNTFKIGNLYTTTNLLIMSMLLEKIFHDLHEMEL